MKKKKKVKVLTDNILIDENKKIRKTSGAKSTSKILLG